ncbi:hypothetical protein [Neobacillus muris]|uniref:hypothetical protein n=1 Tax=Neobacillus muris TaxID=2941334 RepID=UPI00203E72FC|nr:hypothetical protein [Neobacillus muris]
MLYVAIEALKIMKNTSQAVYPTFAYSVIDQYIPGQIYLNNIETSALIGTESGIFTVAGDPTIFISF